MPEDSVLLGFDFGTRRIGVAVGNAVTGSARALAALPHANGPNWAAIARLVAEWRPTALVVGLPLTAAGDSQAMTASARAFIAELGRRFNQPVHAADERFSTIEAVERLRHARATGNRRKRLTKGDTDAMAAQIILEDWLAHDPPQTTA